MRRSFASPFVITVAACSGPVYRNPPPPTHTETEKPATTTTTPIANPPRPTTTPTDDKPTTVIANPPRPTTAGREIDWTVTKKGGTCTAVEKCLVKPHETPPPACQPRPAKCPDGLAEGAGVAVHQAASGECYRAFTGKIECPPNATCNPPPPSKVDCP